ncbi:unnamed protein product [Prunus armeniaca]
MQEGAKLVCPSDRMTSCARTQKLCHLARFDGRLKDCMQLLYLDSIFHDHILSIFEKRWTFSSFSVVSPLNANHVQPNGVFYSSSLKNGLGLPKRETCVKLPLESEFKDQAPRVFRKEISEVRDKACSPDVCLWKERKKMEAWVSLADFQQLDESFVRLLGGLTEEKNGSNGRTRLEIEGF